MPCVTVSQKFKLLDSNGTTDGVADVGDNTHWLPGAIVYLISSTQPSLECRIVEWVGADSVRLRATSNHALRGGGTNISAYLTADGASLNMETQVVPVESAFTPRTRA